VNYGSITPVPTFPWVAAEKKRGLTLAERAVQRAVRIVSRQFYDGA